MYRSDLAHALRLHQRRAVLSATSSSSSSIIANALLAMSIARQVMLPRCVHSTLVQHQRTYNLTRSRTPLMQSRSFASSSSSSSAASTRTTKPAETNPKVLEATRKSKALETFAVDAAVAPANRSSKSTGPVSPSTQRLITLELTIPELDQRLKRMMDTFRAMVLQYEEEPPSLALFAPISRTIRAIKTRIFASPRGSQIPLELAFDAAMRDTIDIFLKWRRKGQSVASREGKAWHTYVFANKLPQDNRLLEDLLYICLETGDGKQNAYAKSGGGILNETNADVIAATSNIPLPDTRRMNILFRAWVYDEQIHVKYEAGDIFGFQPGQQSMKEFERREREQSSRSSNNSSSSKRGFHDYMPPASFKDSTRPCVTIPSELVWTQLCKAYGTCLATQQLEHILHTILPTLYVGMMKQKRMDLQASFYLIGTCAYAMIYTKARAPEWTQIQYESVRREAYEQLWEYMQDVIEAYKQKYNDAPIPWHEPTIVTSLLYVHESYLHEACTKSDFKLLQRIFRRLTRFERERKQALKAIVQQAVVQSNKTQASQRKLNTRENDVVLNSNILYKLTCFYSAQLDRLDAVELDKKKGSNSSSSSNTPMMTEEQASQDLLPSDPVVSYKWSTYPRLPRHASVPLMLHILHQRLVEIWCVLIVQDRDSANMSMQDLKLLRVLLSSIRKCDDLFRILTGASMLQSIHEAAASPSSAIIDDIIEFMKRPILTATLTPSPSSPSAASSSSSPTSVREANVYRYDAEAYSMLQLPTPNVAHIRSLIDDMRVKNITPSSRIFNYLIEGYLTLLRRARAIRRDPAVHMPTNDSEILPLMKTSTEYFQEMNATVNDMTLGVMDQVTGQRVHQVRPDWYTYHLLVSAHRIACNEDDAEVDAKQHLPSLIALYEDMLATIAAPPTRLLDAFLISISRLEEKPDLTIQLYHSILQNGEINAQGQLNENVLWPGVRPSGDTFQTIISRLAEERAVDECLNAYGLLVRMIRNPIPPSIHTPPPNEMDTPLKPTSDMYRLMMRMILYPNRDEMQKYYPILATFFVDLLSFGITPALYHCHHLIEAQIRLGDKDAMFSVIEYIESKGGQLIHLARSGTPTSLEGQFRRDVMQYLVKTGQIERVKRTHMLLLPLEVEPYEYHRAETQLYWNWPYPQYLLWFKFSRSIEMFDTIVSLIPTSHSRWSRLTPRQWAEIVNNATAHDLALTAYTSWRRQFGLRGAEAATWKNWLRTNPVEYATQQTQLEEAQKLAVKAMLLQQQAAATPSTSSTSTSSPPATPTITVSTPFTFSTISSLIESWYARGLLPHFSYQKLLKELHQHYGKMEEFVREPDPVGTPVPTSTQPKLDATESNQMFEKMFDEKKGKNTMTPRNSKSVKKSSSTSTADSSSNLTSSLNSSSSTPSFTQVIDPTLLEEVEKLRQQVEADAEEAHQYNQNLREEAKEKRY